MTISTAGLVPQLRRLGQESAVNLAVSLNASDDETRNFYLAKLKSLEFQKIELLDQIIKLTPGA